MSIALNNHFIAHNSYHQADNPALIVFMRNSDDSVSILLKIFKIIKLGVTTINVSNIGDLMADKRF